MAKKKTAQEDADAIDRAAADDTFPHFPRAMYKKQRPNKKYPNGYETRRVENEDEQARLGPEWKESNAGMVPEFPFTHDAGPQ